MLHGAWPFTAQAAGLILKPNVYVDYSAFMYLTYPVEAARGVRLYLEAAPQKVLYGSDASPISQEVDWEETAWIGSQFGRQVLGLALTGMMQDGEITSERAREIAHMVLRENARQLYGF
jgi:predicted TIM-barrel fold metal-dependent hydrolase